MKKKLYVFLGVIPLFLGSLASCTSLHVHTFYNDYEHDEVSHWKTCSICHERFEEHEHVFNEFNDKCFICDYEDPLVYTDEKGVVTGLTPHGKNKYTFDCPSNVRGIGSKVFTGSKAITVKINTECAFYNIDAFEGSNVKVITTEEDEATIEWKKEGDRMVKHNDYVAMIGDTHYKTLKEAFAAVTTDDTTITLLQDNPEITEPIQVEHAVSLVGHTTNMSLKCNFYIGTGGILYIPSTINYEGRIDLLLGKIKETRGKGDNAKSGNTSETVYNSGAVAFTDRTTRPDNITVSYVESFGEGVKRYPARGAHQVASTLLVVPHDHYAFGALRFSTDWKEIKGLTAYGQTVTKLNITSVRDEKDFMMDIGDSAFAVAWDLKVPIDVIADTHYYNFVSKGFFTDVIIGDGIETVGPRAFNSRYDSDIDPAVVKAFNLIFSHLLSVTFGKDVRGVRYRAFYENVSLTNIGGGESLRSIDASAFEGASHLTTADFSIAQNLNYISASAFHRCDELASVLFAPGKSWGHGSSRYFPYDTSSSNFAYLLVYSGEDWNSISVDSTKPVSYTKSIRTDSLGHFNDVEFASTIDEALTKCCNNGEIYIASNYIGNKNIDYSAKAYGKSLSIVADPGLAGVTVTGGSGGIKIASNTYLLLSNVTPKSNVEGETPKIVLKCNESPAQVYGYEDPAGFGIRNISSDFTVEIDNTCIPSKPMLSHPASITHYNYDAYGLFEFGYGEDRTNVWTLSNLGKMATDLTVGRQVDDGLDNKVTLTSLGNAPTAAWENITLTDDVTTIAWNYFQNCTLKSIKCGTGLSNIYPGALGHSTKLEEFYMPEDCALKSIDPETFRSCTSLKTFTFGKNIATIPERMFGGLESLEYVNFPNENALEKVDHSAFGGCRKLREVSFGNNNTSEKTMTIGDDAFVDCESLETIHLPDNLVSIGVNCFRNCKSLSSIKFGSKFTTISGSAFEDCTALTSVSLPDTNVLTKIGLGAFTGCANLASFHFGFNTENWTRSDGYVTTAIEPYELNSDELAAKHLIGDWCEQEWTRSA